MRAMIALARRNSPGEKSPVVQIRELAEGENIPAKFLEQILLTLKNAGLLHSRLGAGGGYYLARDPEEISLGQIFRVLDGTLAPIKCVSQTSFEPCDCPNLELCGLRMVMGEVHGVVAGILDGTSLADVTRRVEAQQMQVDGQA